MIGALIQARMGSKRLPNKVLQKINKRPILDIMIARLKNSKQIEKIIVCTTNKKEDDRIVNFCKKNNINYFRGASQNVMSRYYNAAKKFNIKTIVRLTADCPLIDAKIIDKMLVHYKKIKVDYLANTNPPENSTFPDGTDVERYLSLTNLAKSIYMKEENNIWNMLLIIFGKKKNIYLNYIKIE